MFLWCERCQVDFLPHRGYWTSACPRCKARLDTNRARSAPAPGPLHIAVRNRAPWVRRWVAPLSSIGFGGGFWYVVSFGRLPTWFSLGLWGVLGTSAVASGIWRWAKRTTVLEVGRGRIAAAWPLSPWPGRWIPASAVQEISSEPAPKGTGLQTVIAKLVGGGKVVLVDDVDSTDVNGVVHGITRALRQPAPALLPEIHVASGERQAQVEWNCGRAVSARIEPTSLSVKCAGEPALELDTDFVDTLVVQPAGELRGVARYDLLAISRKGAAQKLVAGEPAREPLELVANEIRRVLKLTG